MVQVAVIGAGMAGASCARALADAGLIPTVFDANGRPGGRIATRWVNGAGFDYGAQYFSARDPGFERQVQSWVSAGRAAPWIVRSLDPVPRPRFVGLPDMSSPVATLLTGIPVWSATVVTSVTHGGRYWQLFSGARSLGRFDAMVVAVPAPDAQAILADHPVREILATVGMEPCWAATVAFDLPIPIDLDILDPIDGSIVFAARNNSKPGRGAVEAWTIHARPDFSSAQREAAADRVSAQLLAEFAARLPAPLPAVTFAHAHYWPHCLVTRPAGEAYLADRSRNLFLAGDWCTGPRIEAAWLSGRAAAEAVLQTV